MPAQFPRCGRVRLGKSRPKWPRTWDGSFLTRHLKVAPHLAIRAELLENGGPAMWEDFMEELRAAHLGQPLPPDHRPVAACLDEAYRCMAAEAG